ncbi:hypothetical protein PGT21_013220 [Puccinia graminis f. sp. tritici]|uniref:Uncharacterized protein n=1 Tax=Puccinia graminis f. sp. tritici TaxID=56615 RepID=A0A5B0N3R0_PUCGR|nr:hypothetical protein PGT21_013220 [Puccinia graminis f. sp. tritici]KAA1088042.1 hypothetical protein PGTUg99_022831 [Puccinia graminis f. sp. tritici]
MFMSGGKPVTDPLEPARRLTDWRANSAKHHSAERLGSTIPPTSASLPSSDSLIISLHQSEERSPFKGPAWIDSSPRRVPNLLASS